MVATFHSLAFDPRTQALGTTGVTRLAFSDLSGSEIPVRNATQPIQFTLPAVAVSDTSTAACLFWDASAGAYSGSGCVALPSVAPVNHTLAFQALTTPSDAVLPLLWRLSGPLTAGGACVERLVNCGASTAVSYPVESTAQQGAPPAGLAVDALVCADLTVGAAASPALQPALSTAYATALGLPAGAVTVSGAAPRLTVCATVQGAAQHAAAVSGLSAVPAAVAGQASIQGPPRVSVTVFPGNTTVADPSSGSASLDVACTPGSPALLRLVYGAGCALAQPSNGFGCFWSNTAQAFTGRGCAPASAGTQCACRHLTDFASAPVATRAIAASVAAPPAPPPPPLGRVQGATVSAAARGFLTAAWAAALCVLVLVS